MAKSIPLRAVLSLKDDLTKALRKVEKSSKASLRRMQLAGVATGLAFVKLADDVIVLENRIKAVTGSSEEAEKALKGISDIARETRTSISSNAQAFQRFTIATKSMGKSQEEVLALVRQLNLAIKLSGTTATEANAGMIQFAQGMSAGALRGDELRSVLEQMPVVAQVIADGFGVPIDQLKKLGEQGKLVSAGLVKAFDKADSALSGKFGKLKATVGGGLTTAFDQFKLLVGEIDKLFGVSGMITTILKDLTDVIAAAVALFKSEQKPSTQAERDASIGAMMSRGFLRGVAGRGFGPTEEDVREALRKSREKKSLGDFLGQSRPDLDETLPGDTPEEIRQKLRFRTQRGSFGRTGGPPSITPFPSARRRGADAADYLPATFAPLTTPASAPTLAQSRLTAKAIEDTNTWNAAVKRLSEEYSGVNIAIGALEGSADAFHSNISGGLTDMATRAKTAKEAFSDMAVGILHDLQRIIIQGLVAKALGVLGGAFIGGGAVPGPGAGATAAGGPVAGSASPNFRTFGFSLSSGAVPLHEGGVIPPGKIQPAILHGGLFGEEVRPLGSRFDAGAVGGNGGSTTIIYNITAIDVEDFDAKVLGSVSRNDGDVTSVVAARARNSASHRGSFGIG